MHNLLASAGRRATATVFSPLDEHPGRQKKEAEEDKKNCARVGMGTLQFSNKQLLLLHTAALGRQTPAILHGSGGGTGLGGGGPGGTGRIRCD